MSIWDIIFPKPPKPAKPTLDAEVLTEQKEVNTEAESIKKEKEDK